MNVEIKITCELCGLEMEVKLVPHVYDKELEYAAWCPRCHPRMEEIYREEADKE